MKTITLPYVQITQITNFIEKYPKEKVCKIDEVYDLFGKSRVSNLTPTLELLELIDYDKKEKMIKLSDLGIKFRTAIKTKDEKLAGKLIKRVIMNKEPFNIIKDLLEVKKILSSEEIGQKLAFKYGKLWDTQLTFKAHGSAISSILGFAGYGIYSRGILRLEGSQKLEKKPVLPSCSFNTIYKITKFVSIIKDIDLTTLINEFGKKVHTNIGVCIEFGLVTRPAPKQYSITEIGYNLVDSFNKDRNKCWRDCLFKSKYNKLILMLQEKELTSLNVGQFLSRHIGGKWKSEQTLKSYGKKFLSWLRDAELIENISKGKYKMVNINGFMNSIDDYESSPIEKIELKHEIFETSEEVHNEKSGLIKNQNINDFNIDFYKIGKLIGIISSSSSDNVEDIKIVVEELIELCQKYEKFEDVLILIKDHFQLFQDIKDLRIFHSDIKLLEKKLSSTS